MATGPQGSPPAERDRYWQCPECGYLMSDLQKAALITPVPCPRCGRSSESFEPVVGFPR